jgi:D-aminoacyl-tRNA deacylase
MSNIFRENSFKARRVGMRLVVQRSKEAKVTVDGEVTGSITKGFVLLVGVTHEDKEEDAAFLAEKVANLRVFEDESGKMNLSLLDEGGEILSVSQFTLYGDCRKGRRPNFMDAAKPDHALSIYETFNRLLREKGIKVETGVFGAMMDVQLTNDGPVTLILDSK